MKRPRNLLIALGLLVAASSVQAQIDSDPPLLAGQKSYHLYSVPGVINNGMATVISCTNTASDSAIVGVELFGPNGGASLNNASTTAATLPAGGSVMFSTQGLAGFAEWTSLGIGLLHRGSARILSSTRGGVICSAFLTLPGNPPTAATTLTIVKKNKQKGD